MRGFAKSFDIPCLLKKYQKEIILWIKTSWYAPAGFQIFLGDNCVNHKELCVSLVAPLTAGLLGIFSHSTVLAKPFITERGAIPKGRFYLTPLLGLTSHNVPELGLLGSFVIVENGFVPPINNSVSLEGGIFQDITDVNPVGSVVARMRWDFHPHPQWTGFVAPETAVYFGKHPDFRPFQINLILGGFFHISDTISLRAELDNGLNRFHDALRVGASFRF